MADSVTGSAAQNANCPPVPVAERELSSEPRSHWPECLSLSPEPVYDDGTPNPCDCRIWSLIKSRENPEAADRLLAAIERLGPPMAPDTAAVHPHGSLVEQVHRVWTTDQGVDPWVLAEETVKFLRERIARDFERLAGNRNPDDPEGSAAYSRWAENAADRIRHPERYEGCAANAD